MIIIVLFVCLIFSNCAMAEIKDDNVFDCVDSNKYRINPEDIKTFDSKSYFANPEKWDLGSAIKKILDYGTCVKNKEHNRVGNWFCRKSDMVGIQTNDETKKKFTGNIQPKNETFSVVIKEIDNDDKQFSCTWGAYGLNGSDLFLANSCLANFKIEIIPKEEGRWLNDSIDSYRFSGINNYFTMYGDGSFVLFKDYWGSSYISTGKCEKQ